MPFIEIVEATLHKPMDPRLHGCYIDAPKPGLREEADTVDVIGWVLEKDGPAAGIELLGGGQLLQRVAMNRLRPDLAAAFPAVPRAERGGFQTRVSVLGMGSPAWEIHAVLRDKTRVPIGVIRGRRRWREERTGEQGTALVSAIVAGSAQPDFLHETIESVLAQTYPHLEIIVVADGAASAAGAGRSPAVRYVIQEGSGLAEARNTGIRLSNGSYLVFLNSGDRLVPEALTIGLDTLKENVTCAFASGAVRPCAGGGQAADSAPPSGAQDHYAALLRGDCLPLPATVLYCREAIEHVMGFEPYESPVLDYELNLRVARDFSVCWHGKLVAEYRTQEETEPADAGLLLQSALAVLRTQRKHVKSNDKRKQAYRDGLRHWRERYAPALVQQIRTLLETGKRKKAARLLKILAHCHPEGMASLFDSQTF